MNILTNYLSNYFEEINAFDFYKFIFNGELQEKGIFDDGKYNAILLEIYKDEFEKRIYRHTVTNDLDKINEVLVRDNFCLMSPISYVGKTRESKNARILYALAIDLDGIIIKEKDPFGLRTLFHQINKIDRLPNPTFIVSSGTGLHLYYVFNKPIKLFKNTIEKLQKYKKRLTTMLWQGYITNLENNIQYESLFQGFRVVGTITKKGERARAFITGERVDMEYMNSFVDDEFKVNELSYKNNLSLKEAKYKYPEWYKKRIVENVPKGSWITKRDLYDWWLNRIRNEVKVGHRYYCMMTLAVYARKAGISFEELQKDAFELREEFDDMPASIENDFTEKDVLDALQAYDDSYLTFPINSISKVSGINIQKNKRNYQKQKDHLEEIRLIRDLRQKRNGTKWTDNNGRKSKEKIVIEYKKNNPYATMYRCQKETGLSKNTIKKYW